MFCVSVNPTNEEWLNILKQAQQQWPTEQLSRSEIMRRFAMIGARMTRELMESGAEFVAVNFPQARFTSGLPLLSMRRHDLNSHKSRPGSSQSAAWCLAATVVA